MQELFADRQTDKECTESLNSKVKSTHQVDDGVVVILLRAQPGCQLEVVALVQGVEAEVGLDHLGRDADCSAELLQAVHNLCSDVLQRNTRGHGYHGHCAVTLTNERRQ